MGDDLHAIRPTSRIYSDFSVRSVIPSRLDGRTTTIRNSQQMVGLTVKRAMPAVFHWDGEFASVEELVKETLVGRNFGRLPEERSLAISHIIAVIWQDEGFQAGSKGLTAGVPYRTLLKGGDTGLRDLPHPRMRESP